MSTNSLSSSRITELLVALQPHRGMTDVTIVAIRQVVTRAELKELIRLGYLQLSGEPSRVSYTPKAYTHLQS